MVKGKMLFLFYPYPMENLLNILTLVARAMVIFSGGMAAIFLAYAGFQWITAAGDPQKIAQARSSVIGAIVGLVLLGVALIVPGVISEAVIEPAGGIAVGTVYTSDCDGQLRTQWVLHTTASTPVNMNRVIGAIQASSNECSPDVWTPKVDEADATSPGTRCGYVSSTKSIGGFGVPVSFLTASSLVKLSRRDGAGNIFVIFEQTSPPSDGAGCWMYISAYKRWASGG